MDKKTAKPCHFCGWRNIVLHQWKDEENIGHSLMCARCSCTGPLDFFSENKGKTDEERTYEAWNGRV